MFQIKGPILAAMDLNKGSEELLRQADALRVLTRSGFCLSCPPRNFCCAALVSSSASWRCS